MDWGVRTIRVDETVGKLICAQAEEVVGWGGQPCWIGSDDGGGLLLRKPVPLSLNVSQSLNVSDKAINRQQKLRPRSKTNAWGVLAPSVPTEFFKELPKQYLALAIRHTVCLASHGPAKFHRSFTPEHRLRMRENATAQNHSWC